MTSSIQLRRFRNLRSMTLQGKNNHYNVKLLREYGCSIRRVGVAQFDTSEQVLQPSL
jgi:hypothetical protein